MRLTSEIWVSAFVRSEQALGAFVTVFRRGANEAGAIFVIHNRQDGSYSVYAPAPQTAFGPDEVSDRLFECVREGVGEPEMRAYLDRQIAFDPDCWIVEAECRSAPEFLRLAG